MKHILKTIPALLFIFQTALAQNDTAGKTDLNFKFSLNYNSGLNYYGRTDSLKSTGFFPLAELWFSKDVYINAAPIFVNNAVQSFDYAGTVATIGYLHTTDKWITSFYALKPFYKQTSGLVQSALKAQSGFSFSKLTKAVNITAGGDLKYSDQLDFGATAGVDHTFRTELSNQAILVIDPSLYAYAGTQNFTNTYYKKTNSFLLFPGTNQAVTQNVQKFSILAYEFSAPVVYAKGKWMALFTPAYIIPQNLIIIATRPDLSEKGQNMFYATAGLKYSF